MAFLLLHNYTDFIFLLPKIVKEKKGNNQKGNLEL